jgi:hypothetical protein
LILHSFFEEAHAVLHLASRLFPMLEQREARAEALRARVEAFSPDATV